MSQDQQTENRQNDTTETNAEEAVQQIDGGQQPETSTEPGNQINADLSHISGATVTMAGGNVINIRVDSADQARKILQDIEESTRKIPSAPAPDAPLQEQVDHWFTQELNADRQRYFVITLSMFNGLKYPDFKSIYEIVLRVMGVPAEEDKEEKPRSRFDTTAGDLFKAAKAIRTRSESGLDELVKFEDEHYPVAVLDLMRRRYPDILLDLLPALKQVVEQHRYWQIRFGAALAVAEIGKLGFYNMRREVLEPWAGDGRAYVRASAGYPLARLAENEQFRAGIENLLADWTDSHWGGSNESWRYRWTAASVYKQLGLLDNEWAIKLTYNGLRKVAGFDDISLADSVIHSLTVLSLQGQLDRVLQTLKEWVEQASAGSADEIAPQVRGLVGILAFMVLSEVHIELATTEKEEANQLGLQIDNLFELVCQSEKEQGDIWQLVVAIGVRAFENKLAGTFFDLIARWTEFAAEQPVIQNTVRNLLAAVFMQATPKRREHILNRLKRWQQQTKNELLTEMAASAKEKIKEQVQREPLSSPATSNKKIIFGT